jgi:replicative DNA helicase
MKQTKYQTAPQPESSGRVQPQAPELERAVLSAILTESAAYPEIESELTSEDFYVDAHAKIFQAATNLSNKKKPIDILTVLEELKAMNELDNIGGAYYLSEISGIASSSAHIAYHAMIVKKHLPTYRHQVPEARL